MNKEEFLPRKSFSPESFREMALAFQQSRLLLTAYELEIFTVLGEDFKTFDEVAKELGLGGRSSRQLLDALSSIGLLEKKQGKFANTPFSSRFLIKEKPEYMGGLMLAVHTWDTWGTLTQAVRQGQSVIYESMNERGSTWLAAFITAMHERACMQASDVAALLDFSGTSRVLDVGGGSGAYSMAFVKAQKGIRATVFDLPNVVPLTKNYIEKENLLDKIDFVEGDYTTDGFGKDFDLVFLSAIVHMNSFEENASLVRKCADALKPKGQVVIQDFIMEEDRTSPAFGALFALNMLVATKSGDTYTEAEVRAWLKGAGLSGITRSDTEFGTTLMTGRKIG